MREKLLRIWRICKEKSEARSQWIMPVILATWETEIRDFDSKPAPGK
jgi:hypothetical protein